MRAALPHSVLLPNGLPCYHALTFYLAVSFFRADLPHYMVLPSWPPHIFTLTFRPCCVLYLALLPCVLPYYRAALPYWTDIPFRAVPSNRTVPYTRTAVTVGGLLRRVYVDPLQGGGRSGVQVHPLCPQQGALRLLRQVLR